MPRGRGARFSILAHTRRKSAFTLIEIIVVLAISAVIFSFTLGVGVDFYQSQALISERDTLLSLLRSARVNAMDNINQSDHGISVGTTTYVVFEGSSYASRNTEFDQGFPHSPGVVFSGPGEIVFAALEGTPNVSGTVSISNARGRSDIAINSEGRISW
ncbi:MAG: type II secretion system protein [Patescibacteria group bacterium]